MNSKLVTDRIAARGYARGLSVDMIKSAHGLLVDFEASGAEGPESQLAIDEFADSLLDQAAKPKATPEKSSKEKTR